MRRPPIWRARWHGKRARPSAMWCLTPCDNTAPRAAGVGPAGRGLQSIERSSNGGSSSAMIAADLHGLKPQSSASMTIPRASRNDRSGQLDRDWYPSMGRRTRKLCSACWQLKRAPSARRRLWRRGRGARLISRSIRRAGSSTSSMSLRYLSFRSAAIWRMWLHRRLRNSAKRADTRPS